MTAVIVPVVYGGYGKWLSGGLVAHATGTVVGSVLLGLVLGTIANVVRIHQSIGSGANVILGLLLVAFALDEAALLRLPHPQRHAQVPRGLPGRIGASRAAFLFGLVLGTGVLTFIASGTFYAAAVAALVLGAGPGLSGVVAFGLARALPVAMLSWRLSRTERMDDVVAAIASLRPWMHRTQSFVLALASAWILVSPRFGP